ncbi:MAG: 50S ribosomal protein L11 methyltransferase [Chitinophagaceae bacterium]
MNYTEIQIESTTEELQQTLIALLNNIGYEGFEESMENFSFKAFINDNDFDENLLIKTLESFEVTFIKNNIKETNWNALWESNFNPITVDEIIYIRANFHEPKSNFPYQIIITPKMSFGTGHHATTYMCLQLMQELEFKNKTVYDFGSGTGILAIHAEQLGAKHVLAVDNDDWCIENSKENIEANNCSKIEIAKVENASVNKTFDIVIANVNRHIIIENMVYLAKAVTTKGSIIVSGIMQEDESEIVQLFADYNFNLLTQKNKDGAMWIALLFTKN